MDVPVVEREIASAYSLDELNDVGVAVHDWWFDIDDAVANEAGVVTLRLAPSVVGLRNGIAPTRRLKIHHVLDVIIEDPHKVGIYDVEEMSYDERSRRLTLLGGVPVTVSFLVSSLHVSVVGQ